MLANNWIAPLWFFNYFYAIYSGKSHQTNKKRWRAWRSSPWSWCHKILPCCQMRSWWMISPFQNSLTSDGTSSGSSSFTSWFYKGLLKVAKARARLDHQLKSSEKHEPEMFVTSLIFVLKSLNKARARLNQSLSSDRILFLTAKLGSSSLGSGNSRFVPSLSST